MVFDIPVLTRAAWKSRLANDKTLAGEFEDSFIRYSRDGRSNKWLAAGTCIAQTQ